MYYIIVFFGGSVGTVGLLLLLVRTFGERMISSLFAKELESYKSELKHLDNEHLFEIQRRMHDFSIYSSEKQKIYPEIYKDFMAAKLSVSGLDFIVGLEKEFKEFTSEEVLKIAEGLEATEKEQSEFVRLFAQKDFENLNKFYNRLKFDKQLRDSRNDINKLNDQIILNELYMSEDLVQSLNTALQYLRKIHSKYVYYYDDPKSTAGAQEYLEVVKREELEIKRKIKGELRKGDYGDQFSFTDESKDN